MDKMSETHPDFIFNVTPSKYKHRPQKLNIKSDIRPNKNWNSKQVDSRALAMWRDLALNAMLSYTSTISFDLILIINIWPDISNWMLFETLKLQQFFIVCLYRKRFFSLLYHLFYTEFVLDI